MKVWFLFKVIILPYGQVNLQRKTIFSYLMARTVNLSRSCYYAQIIRALDLGGGRVCIV